MAPIDRARPNRPVLLLLVALVGLNLRPFITGVGPLAHDIEAETGLGLQGLALLTLVPMLLVGVFAFAGPALRAKLGARRAVIAALVVLCAGSLLRLPAGTGAAVVGTAALLGLGAAILQAVFPGLIKQYFPHHTGTVMGLYSAMLMAGGALGAQVSPIVGHWGGGWHAGLAWLALPALATAALAWACLPADSANEGGTAMAAALLRQPRAWLLIACFALVNGGYSTVIAWLAPAYQAQGWSGTASGSLLAIMAACQAIAALTAPVLANRTPDKRPYLWATLAMQGAGFAALAYIPQALPFASAALVGAGLGGFFALLMTVALDHLPDPAEAGALSAVMQGGGFLLAALPPWIVAVLHDLTGDFAVGWLMHLFAVAIAAGLTVRLAPHTYARVQGSRS